MTEQLAIGPGMARALRHVAALCDAPTRAAVCDGLFYDALFIPSFVMDPYQVIQTR